MSYYKAYQVLQRRIERTQEVLERRLEERDRIFRPLLVAWVGDRYVDLRDVKIHDKYVDLIYGWYQSGERSRDYSVTLTRELCDSPNAIDEIAALRKASDKRHEDEEKARRIADLKRQLQELE